MSTVTRRVTGSFTASIDDLLPTLALHSHQISAVLRPHRSLHRLAGQPKPCRHSLEREVNERLSGAAGN